MLLLGSSFAKIPVLSIRIGTKVGTVIGHLINPHSLKIDALWVKIGGFKEPHLLLAKDIREASPQGIVINDIDEILNPSDAHRLKKIIDLNFNLIDKKVISGRFPIGKVADYAVENLTFYIRKLYVSPNIWKALNTSRLTIDRSQIIEVSQKYVRISGNEVRESAKQKNQKQAQPAFSSLPSANTSSMEE